MKNNKRKKTLSNNLYIIRLAWKISLQRVLADILINFINYFSWVFYSVVFIKYLLGAIEAGKGFGTLLAFIALTVAVFSATEFYTVWYKNRITPLTNNIINARLNGMLFDKATEVELACFEDTEFYNNYTLAIKEADVRIEAVLTNIFGVFFGAIAATSVLLSMYSIDRYVIFFLASPIIGNFAIGRIANKIAYKRDVESVPFKRKMDYVNRIIYLQNYAKEIRLSNVFNVLKITYEAGYEGMLGIIKKYKGKVPYRDLL